MAKLLAAIVAWLQSLAPYFSGGAAVWLWQKKESAQRDLKQVKTAVKIVHALDDPIERKRLRELADKVRAKREL